MSSLDPDDLCDILKAKYPDVEVWQTGGNIENATIVLEREGPKKEPQRYVMFSECWDDDEASVGFYDERHLDGAEPIATWFGLEDGVPFSSPEILDLVEKLIAHGKKAIDLFGLEEPFEPQQLEWRRGGGK